MATASNPHAGSRIAFVNRFFYPDTSATSQILSDLAFDLARDGACVEVVTSRMTYENNGTLERRDWVAGVTIHRLGSTRFGRSSLVGRAMDYASFLWSVRAWAAQHAQPGCILVSKTDPPMLASVIAGSVRQGQASVVNWVQDLFPEIAERASVPLIRGPVAAALRRMRNRALADAVATVAVGEKMAEMLRSTGAPREGTVHVIHNWADGKAIRPQPVSRSEVRRALSLQDRFVVGYSGNLGRVHEVATIVDAAVLLRDEPRIAFLFVGGGKQLPALRSAVARHRLGNFTFAPYQPREQLGDSLSAADLHLCTLDPRFEGLVVPSKIYGIMAAGRPCLFVGDSDGEIARLVARGSFGSNIAPGDPASLATAIREIADSSQRRESMGENARQLFEREFDMPIAMEKWRALLSRLSAP